MSDQRARELMAQLAARLTSGTYDARRAESFLALATEARSKSFIDVLAGFLGSLVVTYGDQRIPEVLMLMAGEHEDPIIAELLTELAGMTTAVTRAFGRATAPVN